MSFNFRNKKRGNPAGKTKVSRYVICIYIIFFQSPFMGGARPAAIIDDLNLKGSPGGR
jgi:hypothetical protein